MSDERDDIYGDIDPEGPSAEDLARFNRDDAEGVSGSVPCQHCRKAIFDDADVCPHCGTFQLREARRGRRQIWIVILAIIALIAFSLAYTL